MKKIKFNFQHCYGIKNLDQELVFSNRTFAIYAPNGVMKTSFAKTLDDYSKSKSPSDLVFPDRTTVCELLVDDKAADPKSIFVIESYNPTYKSDKISTLLANQTLKEEYDNTHKDIDKSKDAFIKKLKQLSGLTGRKDSIEEAVTKTFGKDFFDFIVEIEDEVSKSDPLGNTLSIM